MGLIGCLETSGHMLLINIFIWVSNLYVDHFISESVFQETGCFSHKWTNLKFRRIMYVIFMAMFNIYKFYVCPHSAVMCFF